MLVGPILLGEDDYAARVELREDVRAKGCTPAVRPAEVRTRALVFPSNPSLPPFPRPSPLDIIYHLLLFYRSIT